MSVLVTLRSQAVDQQLPSPPAWELSPAEDQLKAGENLVAMVRIEPGKGRLLRKSNLYQTVDWINTYTKGFRTSAP